jgi:hypothetical protein
MKRLVCGLVACVAVGLGGFSPGVRADDPAKAAKADPAKEYAALQKEWADAQQAFFKAYQAAKTPEDKQRVLKEKQPNRADFAARFLKFAETHPDSPQALPALAWVVSNARGTPGATKALATLKDKLATTTDLDQLHQTVTTLPPFGFADLAPSVADKARKKLDGPKALPLLVWVCSTTLYGPTPDLAKLYNDTVDLLMERFADRKELAPLADWLARDTDPAWAEKHLRRLLEKNPDDEVKVNTRLGLALVLKNKDEASQPEAEKLFQAVVDNPGNTPPRQALAERARRELDDIKLRGVGKPAPEIAGDDLDGKAFKLSDYKGKVVLLDFWGFW